MVEFEYVIKDQVGIHARPAGLLVKEAKGYNSKVTLNANGKSADATKLMAIMAMAIKCGQTVKVTVDGGDEAKNAEALKKFFEANL